MKQFLMILALLFVFPGSSLPAKACSYCDKIERLRADTKKVKPDALDAKTIDRQLDLLKQGIELILAVLKDKPSLPAADRARVVEIMALVNPYDYQYLLAERLLEEASKSQVEEIFREIDRQEKARKISAEVADDLRISIGVAENSAEHGTDPEAPAPDEAASVSPRKKPAKQ